ncbi:MAG: hypothetical protein HY462_01045 [Parcubacteria group bacterium]|nr:hypothetical protein [Parcubacteria group bacterium]
MAHTTTLIEWDIAEYREHERPRRWYVIAAAIAAVLLLWSILSANFLFAIIIVVAAITVMLQDRNAPTRIPFVIQREGITVGARSYAWSAFKNFWIYYAPGEAKHLFFEWKSGIRPRLSIPLENKNPLRIRAILLQFLSEDVAKENEPLSEQLARLLKL